MTSTTRIISIALATLAIAAPVASAMPTRDNGDIRTSSLAGTTSAPKQDLRNPDQQVPVVPKQDLRNPDQQVPVVPRQDLRNPDQQVPVVPQQQPQTMKPVVIKQSPQPADDDGSPSPLVYILPSLVLVAMLAAGYGYARMSRRPARV
jgi:hypothetical protein